MSQLQFWQKNFTYPAGSYVLDGLGHIQYTAAGGLSGSGLPAWSVNTTDGAVSWTRVGAGGKISESQKPNPGGPYFQSYVDAVSFSRGSADDGKIVLLNSAGQLDSSMGGGGGGGGSSAFSAITGGAANTTAAMVIGTGASLTTSGSGTINATTSANAAAINGIPITGSLTHAGQIPVSQPGNASAVWADPLVQGIQADATSASTINPVLVSGKGADGNQHSLSTDNSGNLNVNVSGGGSGTQYLEGSSPPIATGTVALGKNASNVVSALKLDGSGNLDANIQSASYAAAEGAGVPANAVWVAGSDGTLLHGLLVEGASNRNLRVSLYNGANEVGVTSSRLLVDGSGVTQPVTLTSTTITGTVAVTQSTSPWVVGGARSNNTAVPGAVNLGALVAVANAANPTYTEGNEVLLSTDLTGSLRVAATFSGSVSQNITQWAGTTLAVPTNWGTAASGEVIGVNAELFAGSTALSATSTSLNVNLTGGTTAVTQSTSPWVVGGNKSVNAAAPGSTSVGSLTAQANAAAQTWTEGFLVPLSTDLAGNLRVNATFSGTLSNNITQWNSVALGSPTAFGTAPTGNQIGVNASVFAGSTAITATSTSLNVNVTNPVAGPTSTTANALPGVNPVTVNGTSVAILSSNASRKECIIVNTGTTIIYLGLGATATTTAYHIVLAKCTVANDGTGSSWTSDMWKGSINAIGSTTGGTVVVTELT